ncbi:MAG: peptidylprolyl isomerase [Cyanobacteria bacterium QS_8_64_29]|nr:MAG: peptidylprolyl isomerase [Cyanobacteria bacterium QS_8_64_29]
MTGTNRIPWSRLVRALRAAAAAIVLVSLTIGLSGAWWEDWFGGNGSTEPAQERLPQGDTVTNPKTLLRRALPIDSEPAREFERHVEETVRLLRRRRWGAIEQNLQQAARLLRDRRSALMADVPQQHQAAAQELLPQLRSQLQQVEAAVADRDVERVRDERRELLERFDRLAEQMVAAFPYAIPERFDHLPRLKGRATVELETTQGTMTVVADGYSAPLTAGNFVDLVDRGFYDGLPFHRVRDFLAQTGNPQGAETGFIDPETGQERTVPLEIFVRGDRRPSYGQTLEEAGRYQAQPVLPFSANGTVALARPSDDPNGGSSQFFLLKYDSELTPPGFNVMDGRYAAFGYTIQGDEILQDLQEGDKIRSARVVRGLDDLVRPQGAPQTR